MDLITDLPPSKGTDGHRYDAILSIVDHGLTKGAIFIPTTKTSTTNNITQLFLTHIYA
ncbi:hypothetical protein AN958_04414 [Leucoagaricus sp. SymC.cos]|nr:hypothetical protein AN958_04414 [Leucoagaricus sp. SymC.cos]